MRRLAITAVALTLAVGLSGCGQNAASGPGGQTEVVDDVAFYPACGNETLTLDGVTWYSFVPEDPESFPTPLAMAALNRPNLGTSPSAAAAVPPGPGDDAGTLVIYDGGYAYFRSDSGNFTTWLTTEQMEYTFLC